MCFKIVFLTLLTLVYSRNIDYLNSDYTGQQRGLNYGAEAGHDYGQNTDSDTTVNLNNRNHRIFYNNDDPHHQHHHQFHHQNQDFNGNLRQVEYLRPGEAFRQPDANTFQNTRLLPEEEHRTELHQNQNYMQYSNQNVQKASNSDSQTNTNKYHKNSSKQKNTNENQSIGRDTRNGDEETIAKTIKDIFQIYQPNRLKTVDRNQDFSKTTEFNEVTPKSKEAKNKKNVDDDYYWIWDSKNSTDVVETTTIADKVTLDDRAAFSGDKCPTGKVKFNAICVTPT